MSAQRRAQRYNNGICHGITSTVTGPHQQPQTQCPERAAARGAVRQCAVQRPKCAEKGTRQRQRCRSFGEMAVGSVPPEMFTVVKGRRSACRVPYCKCRPHRHQNRTVTTTTMEYLPENVVSNVIIVHIIHTADNVTQTMGRR